MTNVPSSNLLNDALTLICPEPFFIRKFISISTNDFGIDVRRYQRPVSLSGSVQAVDRKFYDQFGLDFTRRHVQVWASEDIADIYRSRAGDQIVWNGRLWEVTSEVEWFHIDGWQSVLAVEVTMADARSQEAIPWAFGDLRSNFSNSNFYQQDRQRSTFVPWIFGDERSNFNHSNFC